MAKFPALPASVDRYVREIINRMLGRSGNAGDRVVLQEDLVTLGLATEKGQKLSLPATAIVSITVSVITKSVRLFFKLVSGMPCESGILTPFFSYIVSTSSIFVRLYVRKIFDKSVR